MQELKNVWVEKYRPKTVAECILSPRTSETFKAFVASGVFPNLLLTGGAGIGKSSVARALVSDLGLSLLEINASEERGIDNIREKVINFCATVSFDGTGKAVLFEEADGLTVDAQKALRAVIEQYSSVKFIFTANYKNKIIDALHSRTTSIDFSLTKAERETVLLKFIKRVYAILKKEGVQFDDDVVQRICIKHFPDSRRILNELQRCAASGAIDAGALLGSAEADVEQFFNHVKSKDFTKLRRWVVNSAVPADKESLIDKLYAEGYKRLEPGSIPDFILLIADFSYKSAFIVNPEISWMSFVVNLAATVNVKD